MHGLWQKTLVVSEVCSSSLPFMAGVDYVEATLDELPRAPHYYIRNPRGQREAQDIAENGHQALVEERRLSRFLNSSLSDHGRAGIVFAHFEWNQRSPIARLLASRNMRKSVLSR